MIKWKYGCTWSCRFNLKWKKIGGKNAIIAKNANNRTNVLDENLRLLLRNHCEEKDEGLAIKPFSSIQFRHELWFLMQQYKPHIRQNIRFNCSLKKIAVSFLLSAGCGRLF